MNANEQTMTITRKYNGDVATVNAYRVEVRKAGHIDIFGTMPFENEIVDGSYVTVTSATGTFQGKVDTLRQLVDMQGINIVTRIKVIAS